MNKSQSIDCAIIYVSRILQFYNDVCRWIEYHAVAHKKKHERTPLYNKGGSKSQLFLCTQNYLFYIQKEHGIDNGNYK